MKWLAVNRPQIASIFQHGNAGPFAKDEVEIVFDSPFYADMLSEPDRKSQVDEILRSFFKRSIRLVVKKAESTAGSQVKAESGAQRVDKKKALTKEALETEIVREAAEILNAKIHDVRIDGDDAD